MKLNFLSGFAATAFTVVLFLCLSSYGSSDGGQKTGSAATHVKVATAALKSNRITISYPGKVIPREDVNVSFRIAGPISRIKVKQGQQVRKGEVLAEMDDRDYKIQFSATEAEYLQVKAEAERVITLSDRNSVSKNDRDKAVYGLQQITAKYNAHKNALEDTKLRAPFDGYVQKVNFSAGEPVSAGLPVISMISGSAPEVEINIPSEDFIKRSMFCDFYCMLKVYPDKTFPIRLVNITKKANLNQLFTARFAFESDLSGSDVPYAGMSAMVYIRYDYGTENLVSIPIGALFEEDGKNMVWVLENDNTVNKRAVSIVEIKREGVVSLSDGVRDGEQVVTAGVHSLIPGQKVKVMAPETETNVGNLL
ncbi:MAG: efflux RND transporter periplasmic adaptor subunit [Alistipes sp.]|nr:efflux RND transporter periplasmic adaptor subunit [Candidatus Minthomonas equi]